MSNNRKLWGGRFEQDTDPLVERFTESVCLDRRLYREDIQGSIAHARMLHRCGILSEAELVQIREALGEIGQEIEAGTFEFRPEHEDIHMNIEAALIERIGEPALKLHTARSRNDQVACDMRLWTRRIIEEVEELVADCQRALVDRATAFRDLIVPGYTHLQHAQPVLLSHLLLAYVEMLDRDRQRLRDCRARADVSPLGAAALAGTTLPIEPEYTARELGFSRPFRNSIDAVADRDFALEFLFDMSVIAAHLSRLAEEWLLWASAEFDFLDLDESFCTGSSIMPQKKNPDVLELVRGKTATIYGDLTSLLTIMKAQPMAYNRDLQEDKPALFHAADQMRGCLEVMAPLIARATFKEDQALEACRKGHLDATALADYLVGRGVAFREAHRIVGNAVRRAASQGQQLSDLSLEELRSFSELIGDDVFGVLGVRNVVQHYRSAGGSSPEEVKRQLEHWQEVLGTGEEREEGQAEG